VSVILSNCSTLRIISDINCCLLLLVSKEVDHAPLLLIQLLLNMTTKRLGELQLTDIKLQDVTL
jgi:hypothetical protein